MIVIRGQVTRRSSWSDGWMAREMWSIVPATSRLDEKYLLEAGIGYDGTRWVWNESF